MVEKWISHVPVLRKPLRDVLHPNEGVMQASGKRDTTPGRGGRNIPNDGEEQPL